MKKYREFVIYIIGIILVFVLVCQQVKPLVTKCINNYNEIKNQEAAYVQLSQELRSAKQKADDEKKQKELSEASVSKKIYTPVNMNIQDEAAFAQLFEDMLDIARQNTIKIHSIEYVYHPQDDVFVKGNSSKFNTCQVNMKIVSDYADLEGFLQDLYRYNYLINVLSVDIVPYERDKKILLSDLSLKIYVKTPDADSSNESKN